MSAPRVGDRVRVIAGQWIGWDATLLNWLHSGWVWVNLTSTDPAHRDDPLTFTRCLRADEVRKVPTTPVKAPRSAEQATGGES